MRLSPCFPRMGASYRSSTPYQYDVDIQEISRRGQGIARIEGFVIFVPDTKPNDRVQVKITRISQRFAEAESRPCNLKKSGR